MLGHASVFADDPQGFMAALRIGISFLSGKKKQSPAWTLLSKIRLTIRLVGFYISQHGVGTANFKRVGRAVIFLAGLAENLLDFTVFNQHGVAPGA